MPRRDGTGPPCGVMVRVQVDVLAEAERVACRMIGTYPCVSPDGECVCLNCCTRVPHQASIPYYNLSCPVCGSKLGRE